MKTIRFKLKKNNLPKIRKNIIFFLTPPKKLAMNIKNLRLLKIIVQTQINKQKKKNKNKKKVIKKKYL